MRYFEKLFHTVVFSMFIGLMSSLALAADPVKVGFVYVGPIGDHGWTYRHDIGRQQVEDAFGDRVETTFVESVPEGADAERVLTQMALQGADIIFATSVSIAIPGALIPSSLVISIFKSFMCLANLNFLNIIHIFS